MASPTGRKKIRKKRTHRQITYAKNGSGSNTIHMLDTHQTLETPESIDLELHLAGPVVRILAFAIDAAIRMGINVLASMVLSIFDQVGVALMLLLAFVIEWFYPVFFEVFHQGKTPGKKRMGIAVIHDDGTPISWSSSIIRNLLRFVDFLPFGYIAGLISMCSNDHFKRLGDFVAGTLVVYDATVNAAPLIPEDQPLPCPISLSINDQRAILSYAERLHQLSPERQRELANHLSPITGNTAGEASNDNVVWIVRIANWLRGGK